MAALEKGMVNLERHIDNVRNNYGLPCLVAINHRSEDTDAEVRVLIERAGSRVPRSSWRATLPKAARARLRSPRKS